MPRYDLALRYTRIIKVNNVLCQLFIIINVLFS